MVVLLAYCICGRYSQNFVRLFWSLVNSLCRHLCVGFSKRWVQSLNVCKCVEINHFIIKLLNLHLNLHPFVICYIYIGLESNKYLTSGDNTACLSLPTVEASVIIRHRVKLVWGTEIITLSVAPLLVCGHTSKESLPDIQLTILGCKWCEWGHCRYSDPRFICWRHETDTGQDWPTSWRNRNQW